MPKKAEEPTPNLPANIRDELLQSQMESIVDPSLTRVKIVGAAACLYEFMDTNDTERSFEGIVLNYHPRNVLWDKEYGEGPEDEGPACASVNGVVGRPREAFGHKLLDGEEASGQEAFECKTCPYNRWGSKRLITEKGSPKGKACTNQRSLYIMLEGRATPVELTLPPTSLPGWDEYLMSLINKQMPVQTVITKFGQEKKSKGGKDWGQATFEMVDSLDADAFTKIQEAREQFAGVIAPEDVAPETDSDQPSF